MMILGRFRASYAQERMWFLDDLLEHRTVYNVPAVYEIRGRLDRTAFEQAMADLVARHEALRTTFALDGTDLMQVVADEVSVPVTWRDVPDGPGDAEVDRIVGDEADRPFDLGAGPLVRVLGLRRSEEFHVVVVTLHHILVDLRSMEIFERDLGELYSSRVEGRAAALPGLSIQYADFAVWQRGRLEGSESRRQIEAWTRKLDGHRPTDLPLVHRRPVTPTYRNRIHEFEVPAGTAAGLRDLAKSAQATVYMVMLAALKVVLRVYTAADDQTVGGVMPARTVPEVRDVMGLFANTIALRTDLGGDPPFEELVRRVRETAVSAFDCQDLPFEEVVKRLVPQRRGTRNPYFDVLFHMTQRDDSEGLSGTDGRPGFSGLDVREPPRRDRMSFFDLELACAELPDRIHVELSYQDELFDLPFIRRFVAFYLSVLDRAAREPRTRLSDFGTVDDETREVIERNSAGPRLERGEVTVLDVIAETVRTHADDIAVVFEDTRVSYRELAARGRAITEALRAEGIGRGDVVAVCCDRGVDLVAAMLGVLYSGAAVLTIDPQYPQARIRAGLRLSRAALALGAGAAGWEADDGPDAVRWLDISAIPKTTPDAQRAEAVDVSPADTAFVVFTSGSTGEPKAVGMPHRSLHNLLSWHVDDVVGRETVIAAFASIGFDVLFQDVLGALAAGSRMVMVPRRERQEPAALLDLLTREAVEWIDLPPKVAAALCDTAVARGTGLPSLAGVITAGERLNPTDAMREVFAHDRRLRLVNQYGPSETHVATAHRLADEAHEWPIEVPIGRPIPNTQVWVLGEDLRLVPPGVPGEICIGGAAVANGYVNDPRLTAERFVPDPYGAPGGRLYRTGDRGRWLPDGELAFLGRVDDQVKIAGYRVEPGEVAAQLLRSGLVKDAAVRGVESSAGARLVAFVVPHDTGSSGTELDTEALRGHLGSQLPAHMVPQEFVVVDALPRNANGKVDMARLSVDAVRQRAQEADDEPASETERELAALWAQVLGVPDVGRHDNFFELGGHSLAAMTTMARISVRTGIEVSARDLFMAPTVALLASRLAALSETDA
ncbi:amino acid adenylation domain-containing protein [Streptomyces sp. NPDC048191]|uniref:amino acid adenylation domain-containing protein n=1 Tax=Streptomyces sp. NPDC048191 TaxID=3155484 RepID=UPI0034072748